MLEDNGLTDKPGDSRAQVVNVKSHTQTDVVDRIMGIGAEVKVDPSDIVVNNPSELIALIPSLTAGTYRARIVTQYSGSRLLKVPHTYTFDKLLTVE
jgi:malate/lactate dehydrogenase